MAMTTDQPSEGPFAAFPCPTVLRPGQQFRGCQQVMHLSGQKEAWGVTVTIHAVDWARGTLSGSMSALNVPGAKDCVETFWEGEIVDGVRHSFLTGGRWDSSYRTDLVNWSRFDVFRDVEKMCEDGSSFAEMGRLAAAAMANKFIFMRWKELFFAPADGERLADDGVPVTVESSGLSIRGFYYLSIQLSTEPKDHGVIDAFYYDAVGGKDIVQNLELRPVVDEGAATRRFPTFVPE